MCVIYPPECAVSDTVIIACFKNDGSVKLSYLNKMYGDYILMNILIYAKDFKTVTYDNIDKMKYFKDFNLLDEKTKHLCYGRTETDGSYRFEDKNMLVDIRSFDDFINNNNEVICDLKNKFLDTEQLFNNILSNPKKFEINTLNPLINEKNRLEKIIPSFNHKNLYVVNAIIKNEKGFSGRYLNIDFIPDDSSKIIIIPTMHEYSDSNIYIYSFKTIIEKEDESKVTFGNNLDNLLSLNTEFIKLEKKNSENDNEYSTYYKCVEPKCEAVYNNSYFRETPDKIIGITNNNFISTKNENIIIKYNV